MRKVKLIISLNAGGAEKFVNDPMDVRFYSWDFEAVPEGEKPSKGAVFLAEIEVGLPSRDEAAVAAVHYLRSRATEVRAEAEREAREYEERVQNLLALPMGSGDE